MLELLWQNESKEWIRIRISKSGYISGLAKKTVSVRILNTDCCIRSCVNPYNFIVLVWGLVYFFNLIFFILYLFFLCFVPVWGGGRSPFLLRTASWEGTVVCTVYLLPYFRVSGSRSRSFFGTIWPKFQQTFIVCYVWYRYGTPTKCLRDKIANVTK